MLKEDHKNVKDLFDRFEKAKDEETQMQLAKKAMEELKIHSAIEEEIFYPGVRKMVKDDDIMNEAMEEHHVVHMLIDELEQGRLGSDTFHAKFIVLAENVRHHIKEEEGEMMPKLDREDEALEELGGQMMERKQELKGSEAEPTRRSRPELVRGSSKRSSDSE
jgi:hemerythrin superfamily protein